MTDEEFLEQLKDMKNWWVKCIQENEEKLASYHKELYKVQRFIVLLEAKLGKNE